MNLEEIIIYGIIFFLCGLTVYVYVYKKTKSSQKVLDKISHAKEDGIHEPVSLYPYIDPNICIGSGACISACPEKDILGVVSGRAELVNASNCVGHGACFHSCPVEAISLKIGTEKRGVDLPHVNQNFETNIPGIFIAGELGGMGLIKNSVEQGKQALDNIFKSISNKPKTDYDVVIVGAGPAGISASLQAKKLGIKFTTLEQDSLGGTVFNFPRAKVVMTSPMELPGKGKIKLFETSKTELLELWEEVLEINGVTIREKTKVSDIKKNGENFTITSQNGEHFETRTVLLAIGRRGSPRKLNVAGENSEKVAYRLLEPELILNKHVLVVGGGDSAIENALLLADENKVTLSYRSGNFSRLKPKNATKIKKAIEQGTILMEFNSTIESIANDHVILNCENGESKISNDLVYIFAGGELPTQFLEKSGIEIKRRFGYTLKSHKG